MPSVSSQASARAHRGPTLSIDDRALVLSGPDSLQVLSRRGTFDLQGADIHQLHERMEPFLDGAYTEHELLAAVPAPQVATVRGYLARLHQSGALKTIPEPSGTAEAETLERLGPDRVRGRFDVDSRPVDVSLSGLWGDEAARLCFLSPEQAASWLLAFEGPERSIGHQVCVVTEPGPASVSMLRKRAGLASWLLASGAFDPGGPARCQLFQLDSSTGSLRRLALIEPQKSSSGLDSLPGQLELFHDAGVEQMPLVVGTAQHALFPSSVTCFGIEWESVRVSLFRRFIVAAWLAATAPARSLTFYRGPLGAPLGSFSPVRSTPEEAATMVIAENRRALETRLLERAAVLRSELEPACKWRQTDLSTISVDGAESKYLQRVLGLRTATLPVAETTVGGLRVLHCGDDRASSFVPGQAAHELLLRLAYRLFHQKGVAAAGLSGQNGAAPVLPASSAAPAATVEATSLAPEGTEVIVQRIRCWGVSAWVGALVTPGATPGGLMRW